MPPTRSSVKQLWLITPRGQPCLPPDSPEAAPAWLGLDLPSKAPLGPWKGIAA